MLSCETSTFTAGFDMSTGSSMEYLQTSHSSSLQEAFSLIDSKYEIPEDVNENVLRTLGKDVEMQTFKTNISEQHERSDCITIAQSRYNKILTS